MAPTLIGFDPEDWDEVLHFELRFVTQPSDDLLQWLGQRWESWWVPWEREPWLFHGDFAAFDFSPRPGREQGALAATLALIEEVHARAPIVEASCGSLPKSALDDAVEHPAFAQGVRRAQGGKALALVKETVAEAADQHIKLAAVPEPRLPQPEDYPPEARAWLPTTIAATLKGATTAPYVWLEEHHAGSLPPPLEALALPDGLTYRRPAMIVPRGRRALVALNEVAPAKRPKWGDPLPPALCLVSGGQVTLVWTCAAQEEGIYALAWIDDQIVVVTTAKRTVVLSLAEGKEVAQARGTNAFISVSQNGRLIAGSGRVFAWLGGKLIPAARYKTPELSLYHWDERRVLLRLYNSDGVEAFFELTHIDEALAALEPKKKVARHKKS